MNYKSSVCDFLHPPANSSTLRMFHAQSPKYQDKQADQPAKREQHHITYTCCLCWNAMVGNNSFSKKCMYMEDVLCSVTQHIM